MARGAAGKKKNRATVQQSITENFLPLLKKPAEMIGKTFKVPGVHWGSSCPAAQANKNFVCAIKDFSFAYKETPDGTPCQAFLLSELGEDGHGGNSVDFWMKYPTPMLQYWYDTYPDDLEAASGYKKSAAAEAKIVGDTECETAVAKESRSKVFDFLEHVSSDRVTSGPQRGRVKHIYKCCIVEYGNPCGRPVTIYGTSTGPFFKHVRQLASKQGNVGHASARDVLNNSSSRQVQRLDGTWITVFSFEEAFTHHVDFVWLVAGGLPIRLNRRPAFLEYVRGFQPRAVMPHHETVHRIVECIDELQQKNLAMRLDALMKDMQGLPCVGAQLDMWTDRNTGICYAAFHVTSSFEGEDSLELHDDLLDFSIFPFTEHTGENIKSWIISICDRWHIPLASISGVTPDGAADGVKALKLIKELKHSFDICGLHQLQRSILYAIGLAASKSSCRNRTARDLIAQHKRVVQLSHQSREISDGFRAFQTAANIPPHKLLTTVRTNATRWGNQKAQITRNIVMRPIQDHVITKYKREHIGETVLLETEEHDDQYTDDEEPRTQFSPTVKAITRRDVGLGSDAWNTSLELEAFLERPWGIKELVEKCPYLTGAQMTFLMISLQKNNAPEKDLKIKTFPLSASLKHRNRATAVIKADSIHPVVVVARKELVEQLNKRFLTTMPSETRLVQLYMSKQAKAAKLLPEEWVQAAKAFYLVWLRKAAHSRGAIPATGGANKKQKTAAMQRMMLFDGLEEDDSVICAAVDATQDDDEADPVHLEVQKWSSLAHVRITPFVDPETGMLNEFKLLYSLRKEFPLHYTVFRQTCVHISNEANAEDTFSLSGIRMSVCHA